ncbi:MAG: antibiotic biosynthesis monooxygenase [Ruminococcus sp.]|nr:antibiotic biosynthesis monooxygenase [Ruminococcus sp.]
MIRLNIFMTVSERHHAEVRMIADQFIEASLKDKGCMGYDFFQSITRPEVMMICETWESRDALESHQQTDHFKRLSPLLHSLCEMKTEILEKN